MAASEGSRPERDMARPSPGPREAPAPQDRVHCAVSSFAEGFSCSQAILGTYAEMLGLERQTALRLAASFGGGMGRMAQTCGAVTGAFMVLGLKYGSTSAQPGEAKERLYGLVREFADRFRRRQGSIVCKDLLGCDLSTPEGVRLAKEEGIVQAVCPQIVRYAAELLEELL